jgi:hypothetical protein
MRPAAHQLFLHQADQVALARGKDLLHLPAASFPKRNVEQIRALFVRDDELRGLAPHGYATDRLADFLGKLNGDRMLRFRDSLLEA